MNISEFIDETIKKDMYRDIRKMISENIAIPCIISLFAYSEVIGAIERIIRGESENMVFGSGQSNRNFEAYMEIAGKAYKNIEPRNVYRLFRGGLIHRYFPERRLLIKMNTEDPVGLLEYGRGCPISIEGDILTFNVNQYFHDMKQAVNRMKKQLKRQHKEEVELYRGRNGILVQRE